MRPAGVNSSTYFDFGIENNDNDPNFEVGDHARISKYKNIFATSYTPNWSEGVLKKSLELKRQSRKKGKNYLSNG